MYSLYFSLNVKKFGCSSHEIAYCYCIYMSLHIGPAVLSHVCYAFVLFYLSCFLDKRHIKPKICLMVCRSMLFTFSNWCTLWNYFDISPYHRLQSSNIQKWILLESLTILQMTRKYMYHTRTVKIVILWNVFNSIFILFSRGSDETIEL